MNEMNHAQPHMGTLYLMGGGGGPRRVKRYGTKKGEEPTASLNGVE